MFTVLLIILSTLSILKKRRISVNARITLSHMLTILTTSLERTISSNYRNSSNCHSSLRELSTRFPLFVDRCSNWVTSTLTTQESGIPLLKMSSTTSTLTMKNTARSRNRRVVAAKSNNCNSRIWELYSLTTRNGERKRAKCASPRSCRLKRSTSWVPILPPTNTTASAINATTTPTSNRTKLS